MSSSGRRHVLAMTIFAGLFGVVRSAFAQKPRFTRVADLRKLVIAALKERAGVSEVTADSRDPAKIHTKVRGGTVTSDVTNLFGLLNAYPDRDVNEAIERFIRAVVQEVPEAVDPDKILPVLRTHAYIEGLRKAGIKTLAEAFAADLSIIYMADSADAMSPVDPKDVPGKSAANLRPVALANLDRWYSKLHSDNQETFVLYTVEGNEPLAPSLLLADKFWTAIAGRFPNDVLIAIPRRDQLFIFDGNVATATQAARHMIAVTWAENFNLLSDKLYMRRNGKIVLA